VGREEVGGQSWSERIKEMGPQSNFLCYRHFKKMSLFCILGMSITDAWIWFFMQADTIRQGWGVMHSCLNSSFSIQFCR